MSFFFSACIPTYNSATLKLFFRGVKVSEGNRPVITLSEEDYEDVETYLMSKSYFDLKEYDRCNFFTANCKKSPR